MNKLLLKNIKIIQWRGLHNINLDFDDSYNEICGKNGSGKSSILELIQYMLFDTKNPNKHSKNINSLDSLPNVEMVLSFNNEPIYLFTQKDQWFINSAHYNTKSDYQIELANKLKLRDIKDIQSNIFPNLLEDIFLTNKQDSKEGRDELMSILEPKLSNESRHLVNNGGLKLLFDEIYSLNDEIKSITREIKIQKSQMASFKENNKDILNWDSDINNIEKEIIENNDKITKYEEVETKISNLRSEKIKLENTLDFERKNQNLSQNTKLTFVQILLVILTFGIYLIFLKSKVNNANQISEYHSSLENEKIKSKISKIQSEMNDLAHDKNYQDVDIEKLRDTRKDLESASTNESIYLAKKSTFKKMNDELEELEKKLKIISEKLEVKQQIKTKISLELSSMLTNEFSNFQIELFDSKGNERIQIRQNNIDLKFLNYANKWNIIFEINDFLKNKTLNSFTVIDGVESFNKISHSDNVQVICAKVTEDEKLVLNGKYIN